MKRSATRDRKLQEAISFLVKNVEESGDNEKPVILHSVRVGMYLDRNGYPTDTVVAGILHDLLEDTRVEEKNIEEAFGKKVVNLVKANSFNKEIEDYEERYKDTFKRCLEAGKDALAIKAVDILDNSNYYHLAKGEMKDKLMQKMNYFLDVSGEKIKKEKAWKELEAKFKPLRENK